MSTIGTTTPDDDPALQRLLVERRERIADGWLSRTRRERAIEIGSAIAFTLAAVSLSVLAETTRSVDPWIALSLVAAYAVAARVEFETGSAFTCPTQLVLVPMLFLLPAAAVPATVAVALVVSRIPSYVRGEIRPDNAIVVIGDAWHAMGPAVVLTIAGTTAPEWSDWPIYLGALAAQFATDLAATLVRFWLALGVPLRVLLDEERAIFLVDTLVAPVGLLAAFAVIDNEWAFLGILPLVGLIAIFAREREARIENALALSSAYRGTAHLLGEVLSSKHEYTGSHSRSVVVLAHQVSEGMGLDERTLREIELGALLHDVGKMAVPNAILNKPGPLNDAEWEVMRAHSPKGEEMLTKIGGVLAEAGTAVRSHHERYDGEGYPDGLAGDAIPVASRVIAACDAFNAMLSDRPYRAALPLSEAVVELRANAGTQFDPAVVETLVAIVSEPGVAYSEAVNGNEPGAPQRRLGALAS